MNNFVVIIALLSLLLGIIVFIISILFYLRNRNILVGIYVIIQIAILIYLLLTLYVYCASSVIGMKSFDNFSLLIRILKTIQNFFLLLLPIFLQRMLSYKNVRKRNIFFLILAIFVSILAFSPYFFDLKNNIIYPGYIFQRISIYFVFFYSLIIISKNLKKIKNKHIVFMMRVFIVLNIMFFPNFIIEDIYIFKGDMQKIFIVGVIFGSVFYFIWNIFFINFISNYVKFLPIIINLDDVVRNLDILEKYKITTREKEIIFLLVEGYSKKEVAQKLFISELTVKTHIRNIYEKLGVKNRIELLKLVESSRNTN